MATFSTATSPKTKIFASIAAYSLIIASAGFGAKYAWMIGIQHGYLMAYLSVIFAIALECIKPLSICYAFSAYHQAQVVRGSLLLLLGGVAICYSLTAELALIYGARSDLAAARHSETFSAAANQQQYETALRELKALPKARATIGEVNSDVALLKSKYPNVDWDCEDIRSKQSKAACPQLGKLNAEIAVIQRREKLQGTVDGFLNRSHEKSTQKLADPGSAAITTYLSVLGVQADQNVVAQFVVLIPVFALEIASALGLLLVNAINEGTRIDVTASGSHPQSPNSTAKKALLSQLEHKGEAQISQRRLAKVHGLDKSTIQKAISELKAEGIIDFETARQGTLLRLKKDVSNGN